MKREFSDNAMLRRNDIARSMYGFRFQEGESIVEAAERAANRIYSEGLSFRNGVLSPGSNNAWAFFAAEAFRGRLDELRDSGAENTALFASLIEKRLAYIDQTEESYDSPEARQLLQDIYDLVQSADWEPAAPPRSFDARGRYIDPAP